MSVGLTPAGEDHLRSLAAAGDPHARRAMASIAAHRVQTEDLVTASEDVRCMAEAVLAADAQGNAETEARTALVALLRGMLSPTWQKLSDAKIQRQLAALGAPVEDEAADRAKKSS